jgi:hypothetical protein
LILSDFPDFEFLLSTSRFESNASHLAHRYKGSTHITRSTTLKPLCYSSCINTNNVSCQVTFAACFKPTGLVETSNFNTFRDWSFWLILSSSQRKNHSCVDLLLILFRKPPTSFRCSCRLKSLETFLSSSWHVFMLKGWI